MRRVLEVSLLISTTVLLIATSRAPERCATETVVLHARTSCGPETDVTFTSNTSCAITASAGAGLPTSGNVAVFRADAGVLDGFELFGPRVDGGSAYDCSAVPDDGGLFVNCNSREPCAADGGSDGGVCEPDCEGSLTRP